jgi:MYXO-CTERM domain-containing protein
MNDVDIAGMILGAIAQNAVLWWQAVVANPLPWVVIAVVLTGLALLPTRRRRRA